MSYTDERDELAELFGAKPIKRKSGYSEDLDESKLPAPVFASSTAPPPFPTPVKPETPLPTPVKPEPPLLTPVKPEPPLRPEPPEAAGSALPVAKTRPLEVKTPVKLRPPAHVDPHPLDLPPARDVLPRPAAPPPPAEKPRSPHIVEDEEFLNDDTSGMADFFDLDLIPRDDGPATPPPSVKAKSAPVPATERPAPAPRPSAPAAERIRVTAPESARPPKTGNRSDLQFTSDERLPHPVGDKFLLDTHGLVKIYDGRTVVNGVDITVRTGEIVGLLGPNGAGKTTSFYMIVGLVPPNGGQVLFNGSDVTSMPMYKRARLGMGYLPQEESIFRKLTVEENIMAVMETLDIPRKEKLERCQELLERFSITHIRKNIALTCSGGEKRRLTIARSLVTTPSLLMLDEPFSGVDPIAVNEIQNIVEDLRKSGIAILITDHNARQTLELVDRAYLIYEGRVLREGTRDFLINDPVSRELYLGDRFTM